MSGSEFQFIQSYFSDPPQTMRSDVLLGIGDDCAIVAPRRQANLVLSVDTLVDGVHFPHNTSPKAIAYKALAVNLSDLAAMGAEPAWFTLSLTLPEAAKHLPQSTSSENMLSHEKWLHEFSQSLFSLARQHNINLIGGDTSQGPFSITIQIFGYVSVQGGLKRSGAKVGDIIAVTGSLGAAAIGLDIALKQKKRNYACLSEREQQLALQALNFPQARITAGMYLQTIAHSALDLSDGLLSDLGHILKASGVAAELELEKLPLSSTLACLDKESAWEKALTGGDDYELCFTVAKKDWPMIANQYSDFVAIGTIVKQTSTHEGVRLLKLNGQEYIVQKKGYEHFE